MQPTQHFTAIPQQNGSRKLSFWNWPAQNGNNGHVTVCVHGLTRQSRDFDVLAADLSADRRVVSVDVAGRGDSDWLADSAQYVVPTYVQDMAVLLAQLKTEGMTRLDWVGTSMGGLIGLGVAGHPALQAAHPITKLVLNDVGPALEWAAISRIASYVGKDMVFDSLEAAASKMWENGKGFGPHSAEQWLALSKPMTRPLASGGVRLHYDPALAIPFKALTQESSDAGGAALWALYDAIQAQTLVLRGALSDLLTPSTLQDMQRRGPKAQAHVFEGVGHAPMLVHADQRAVVRAFLDSA